MQTGKRFWWSIPAVPENVARVIVRSWEPLTENEIEAAFRGNETTQWWRALIQILQDSRDEYVAAASQQAAYNNPLGMAREIGAHEALSNLLTVLEKKVEGD